MDNPIGLSNMIINEFLGENRPVTAPVEGEEDYMDGFIGYVDENEMGEAAEDLENEPQDQEEK